MAKAIASGLGGAILGWGAASMTLAGRVDALERGQQRIEVMLTTLVMDQRNENRRAQPGQKDHP